MSNMSERGGPGLIPNRWLNCPRKADPLIIDQFLAFKTPLNSAYNDQVPEANRFTPKMLFDSVKSKYKRKIGLLIDLTNTSRFYDKAEIEGYGCRYIKLKCRGHGETPTKELTQKFITTVNVFIHQKPDDIIGVHCTHGFNRTGFLIISYLVEHEDWSLEAAIREFAKKREPGIYKQDYIKELYERYDDVDNTTEAPPRPNWCIEEEVDEDDEDNVQSHSQSMQSQSKKKAKRPLPAMKEFVPYVNGVTYFKVEPRVWDIQKKAQVFCKWPKSDFPGSQPVSMDLNNLPNLSKKPYRVSWKADGARYMMIIDGKDEVYLIDRDNCVFKVHNLSFPHNKDPNKHLRDTLLDGELVIDEEKDGTKRPRYLCYDIIRFENINVGKAPFYPVRLKCIETEIINPRDRAISNGMIIKEDEPFRVVLKQFWDVTMSKELLEEKFSRTLKHEPDGLIFQPSEMGYIAGTCSDVLKWKPSNMNSIDFQLKIETECGTGIVPQKIGSLYLAQMDKPLFKIKLTPALKHLNNKIIECKLENNVWVFMRERTDKSFPNSYKTAMAVLESIQRPVTKEILLNYIDRLRYKNDFPPPEPKRPRI